MAGNSCYIKILSGLGFVTFPMWLFLVCFYVPDAANYDFVQNADEFTSIGAFMVVIVLFFVQLLLNVIVGIFAINKKNAYKINGGNKVKLVLKCGILLNFLPLVLLSCFCVYLLFFYE